MVCFKIYQEYLCVGKVTVLMVMYSVYWWSEILGWLVFITTKWIYPEFNMVENFCREKSVIFQHMKATVL